MDILLDVSKFCRQLTPCEDDYWCKDCNVYFCSCSAAGDEHDDDPKNTGHKVYDANNVLGEPIYIVGQKDKWTEARLNPKPLPRIDIKEITDSFIKELNNNGIPSPLNLSFNGNEANFSIEGPRHSIVIYRIWGRGVVNVWLGKSDDDSGGRATQCNIEFGIKNAKNVINLHKRFYKSGRRKVLRNYRSC